MASHCRELQTFFFAYHFDPLSDKSTCRSGNASWVESEKPHDWTWSDHLFLKWCVLLVTTNSNVSLKKWISWNFQLTQVSHRQIGTALHFASVLNWSLVPMFFVLSFCKRFPWCTNSAGPYPNHFWCTMWRWIDCMASPIRRSLAELRWSHWSWLVVWNMFYFCPDLGWS